MTLPLPQNVIPRLSAQWLPTFPWISSCRSGVILPPPGQYPYPSGFPPKGEVPTHQHQVVAILDPEATLRLEATPLLEAILVPHSPVEPHPTLEFLQARDLEPHQVEQAILDIHSHLHSLTVVAQHRSHYLVVFLEDSPLSILEDKLLTLVSLLQ